MKAEEVHNMGEQELAVEEARLRKQLFNLRCQAVTEKLENPMQLRNLRKDIARLLTEKRARETRQQQEQA